MTWRLQHGKDATEHLARARHAMPLDTTGFVQGAFYALLFGLLSWAAFGGALSGLMG